jgi:transcriptional regulator with XRE-family HTH domain
MLNLEKIGQKITTQRKQMKLTQNELAETLFVTHQAVSKWENGKSIPSIEILYEMTKLFNISIDYLLDNSEIDPSDYESQFKNVSREVVISNFLKSDSCNEDINNIFYLLTKKERYLILNLIMRSQTTVTTEAIWPYLNDSERQFLLGVILSNKLDVDLNRIWHHLSNQERKIVSHNLKNGIYNYTLNNIIRSEKNEKKQ